MKRLIIGLFLVWGLVTTLVGCSEKNQLSNMFSNAEVSTEAYGFAVAGMERAVDAEGGVYLFTRSNAEYLFYWDVENNMATPLCGKPECAHNDGDCNAYFGGALTGTLAVYDGKIYLWAGGGTPSLYRMDLDGSNREKIAEGVDKDGQPCVPNQAVVSNGYYYMIMALGGDGWYGSAIYRQDLEGKNSPELIFELEKNVNSSETTSASTDIFATEDKVYFRVNTITHSEVPTQITDVYAYDIETENIELVFSYDNDLYFAIKDNILYYSDWSVITALMNPTRKRNLETGEDVPFAEEGGTVLCDDEYVYISGRGYCAIYDYDGNLIVKETDVIKSGSMSSGRTFTPKHIIVEYVEDWENMNTLCHVYNKDDIGTEDWGYVEQEFILTP